MTVAVNDRLSGPFTGNGATTAFAYDFRVEANTELRVILRSTAGVDTVKTLTTHYTVSGVGVDGGGNVTFVTAPATGEKVIIEGVTPKSQTVEYVNNDRFPYSSHQTGVDKMARQVQELQRDADRALKYPHGETVFRLPMKPASRQYLVQEATGEIVHDDGPLTSAIEDGNLVATDSLQIGDGVTTTFTVASIGAARKEHLDVSLNGLTQPWSTYGVTYDEGTGVSTISFGVAPWNGAKILFRPRVFGISGDAGGGGGTGDMLASNNLSDVASVAAARTNLGLEIGLDVQAYSLALSETTASFTTADEAKLDGIEEAADVTDAANVAAAGALMTSSLGAGVQLFLTTPSSVNLSAALSDETGTNDLVFSDSPTIQTPTLIAPALGTPSAAVLTNATGLPVSSGISGLAAGIATFLTTPSSANLLGAITDETGTGALVFASAPTIANPTFTGTIAGAPSVSGVWTFAASPTGPTPAGSTDLATKGYVDSVAVGLQIKDSVAVATTADISLTGEQTIDDVLTSASRILVKNQSTASQNGIYVTAAGAWSRATDMDAWSEAIGALVPVTGGTLGGNAIYGSTAAAGGTLGSTSFTFSPFITTSGLQPLDGDLTAIAALTTASYGRGVLEVANAAALRTYAGVVIGTDVQAYAANLTTWAGVTPAAGIATFLATPSSANLRGAVTDETGTGSLVFATSPALVTPDLGTPSAAVLTNATGLPVASGISGLGTNVAAFLATPTSANLLAAITNETGTGLLVFATSPSLTTPAIAGATLSGTLAGDPDFSGTPRFNRTTGGAAARFGGGNAVISAGALAQPLLARAAYYDATAVAYKIQAATSGGWGMLSVTNAGLQWAGATGTFAAGDTIVPTFIDVALRTGAQTLTDKTLTSPVINNPTINAGSGTLVLPQSSSIAPTAEGSIGWDTDDNLLKVGDGVTTKTVVDTNTAQAISNKSVTATGGSVARTLEAERADEINVLDHCATVDGSTDNTTGITAALALGMSSGKVVRFRKGAGSYITQPQTCASAVNIVIDPGVTVKLIDSATLQETSTKLWVFKVTASDFSLIGGKIDFNKANQDRAAFNAAGGSAVRSYWPVYVIGTSGTHIERIRIKTEIVNAADYGVASFYADEVDVSGTIVRDSSAGVIVKDFTTCKANDITLDGIDNADWLVSPNAIDIKDGDVAECNNLNIINQSGYDTSAGNSRSDWFQGVGVINVRKFHGNGWRVTALNDAAMTKSVGISLLYVTDANITNVTCERYTSVGLEMGGCRNVTVSGDVLDGGYLAPDSGLWPTERGTGIHTINQGFSASRTRILTPNINCSVEFRRVGGFLGPGAHTYMGCGTRIRNTVFEGNLYGVLQESDSVNESFPSGETQATEDEGYDNCDFVNNEGPGFYEEGGINTRLTNCRADNNGQARNATVAGTTRGGVETIDAIEAAGYYAKDGSPAVERVNTRLQSCRTQDSQSDTSGVGSADPGSPRVFYARKGAKYRVGQWIKLIGCGTAAADLKAYIVSIAGDAVTIHTDIITFPTSTKTGTLSTSSTTITGTGTAFLTEITSRMYLKNGSNYRLIDSATTNTAGTLTAAFSPNLSGQAVEVVQFTVEQMRSQQYGIVTNGATNDATFSANDHDFGAGNVTANTSLAAPADISLIQWATPISLGRDDFVALNGSPALGLNSASNRMMWLFDAAGTERIASMVRVPKGLVGVRLRPVLYWTNNGAGSGNVVWRYSYHHSVDGGATETAATVVGFSVLAAPAQNVLKVSRADPFTVTADSILHFALDREGGNGSDTLANDAGVFEVVLEVV
jgi:hypothetical protein